MTGGEEVSGVLGTRNLKGPSVTTKVPVLVVLGMRKQVEQPRKLK